MEKKKEIYKWLDYIDPATLTYQEWFSVGAAMKYEGLTASDWEEWSKPDPRHKNGECFRKWNTFERTDGDVVTGGTIYELARQRGYIPAGEGLGHEIGWDDEIGVEGRIVDPGWVEATDFQEPSDKDWHPVKELITYLKTLFQPDENVGYVTGVYENEDRLSPKKGNWDRTAGQLIAELKKCEGDIGSVIGDVNPAAGAWIRFNPLDGEGIKNSNVTDFRYALVESDSMELGKQEALIRQLELPVAALVFSGSKSIHAIVRVDAADYQDYKKRVEYLYSVCAKNGLVVDTQNKNPSRLSRMPGVIRNGHKQFLIATNIGKSSWEEWEDWAEGINDNLPDPESLSVVWNDMPKLADELIAGMLRKGHKMLIAGPSKSGKSFLLIELCIAIAEGRSWLARECAQGRVLYVNLELDRASCLHRFKDVYAALNLKPKNLDNIEIWNLRGKAVPMDKLAPKLIRRAEKKAFTAVVIDPIYKVITGDENSASEMARFCNQFDKIASDLGCAVIYCHHHAKGLQGQKRSMDRASGSGVFARDPDAMLDMSELNIDDAFKARLGAKAYIDTAAALLNKHVPEWDKEGGNEDTLTPLEMQHALEDFYPAGLAQADAARTAAENSTAWRIEGILREFHNFDPINLYFQYPRHVLDDAGLLEDLKVEAEKSKWQRGSEKAKQNADDRKKALENAFDLLQDDGHADAKAIAEYMGMSIRTIKDYAKHNPRFYIEKGMIFEANNEEEE